MSASSRKCHHTWRQHLTHHSSVVPMFFSFFGVQKFLKYNFFRQYRSRFQCAMIARAVPATLILHYEATGGRSQQSKGRRVGQLGKKFLCIPEKKRETKFFKTKQFGLGVCVKKIFDLPVSGRVTFLALETSSTSNNILSLSLFLSILLLIWYR